jgi:serine protease Do
MTTTTPPALAALRRSALFLFTLAAAAALAGLCPARADDTKATVTVPALPDRAKDKPLPAAFLKANPENLDDLKAIEKHLQEVAAKVVPCTVCIRATGSGSGVLVSADGLILTAGHVSGEPGRNVTVLMPDGKSYKAKTLGGNGTVDSGMVKITEAGTWPFVELGQSSAMKKGDWCLTTGHPGGFKTGRSPVVRVGRILEINDTTSARYIRTDCTLVGGDSGGPLFDMHGRVIGIHSRIGGSITANLHVPVDTYRETWDRLVKGERWGRGIGRNVPPTRGEPDFGLKLDPADKACTVTEVQSGSPAAKAGVKVGDVIKEIDGRATTTAAALLEEFKRQTPGDEVTFEIQRGPATLSVRVVVGRKPGA